MIKNASRKWKYDFFDSHGITIVIDRPQKDDTKFYYSITYLENDVKTEYNEMNLVDSRWEAEDMAFEKAEEILKQLIK
jgi:hypothetical protein